MSYRFWMSLIFLAGCAGEVVDMNEARLGVPQAVPVQSGSEFENGTSADLAAGFTDSAFSSYIQFSADKKLTRYSYNFFPEGTDFNFETKTVSIPCSFLSAAPADGVDIALSAPIEQRCQPYVLNFGDSDDFTLYGIVTPADSEKFLDTFEFMITPEGALDTLDGSLISSTRGKFEDYYDLVLKRRQEQALVN